MSVDAFKRTCAALVGICLLGGCIPEAARLVKSETHVFTIERVRPPKHVYVDLRRADGTFFRSVYVAKHCNNWCRITIGSSVALTVETYERDGKRWESIQASSVCPRTSDLPVPSKT